jgi:hypothetical protein
MVPSGNDGLRTVCFGGNVSQAKTATMARRTIVAVRNRFKSAG